MKKSFGSSSVIINLNNNSKSFFYHNQMGFLFFLYNFDWEKQPYKEKSNDQKVKRKKIKYELKFF